jgi:two-component system sensor histidine kinase HydH
MKRFESLFISPKTLLLIFLSVAALVIVSAYNELKQSKAEMLDLMSSQAHSLLETILVSSEEILYAQNEVESETIKRVRNNAKIIDLLLNKKSVSNSVLSEIAKENNIVEIQIYNYEGKLLFSTSRVNTDKRKIVQKFAPIINGKESEIIFGIRENPKSGSFEYTAAIATERNRIISITVDATELINFRKNIGFGILLRRLSQNKNVIYTALQSDYGILAASENVDSLSSINQTPFLQHALNDSTFTWRIAEFNGENVFEAAHPFVFNGNKVGVFRIGLNLAPLNSINERITRRIIVIGIFLLLFGSILIVLVFVRQNLVTARKQYRSIETFSKKLIENVQDAIIVTDENYLIKEINISAETLLGIASEKILKQKIFFSDLLKDCLDLDNRIGRLQQIECEINGSKKYLLVSQNEFTDESEEKNYVILIKDLTDLKELEKQIQRSEELLAMGELASGVAHEIRNPLNAIGTIVQQLDKDFEPADAKEEYHSLARLVYKEVRRINDTIKNFLKFAKPEPIVPDEFELSELIEEIRGQYSNLLSEKNISFSIKSNWNGTVYWDFNKIKQVLINLINNAQEAIKENGEISLDISKDKDNIIIKISDNGIGIPDKVQSRIFSLYFTTKAEGTGIGLSIIQRIINEHNGIIDFKSKENVGTTFTIKLPVKFKD